MLGLLKADATIILRLASVLIIISTAAASPASFAPPPPDRSGPSGAAAAHPVGEARASVTNPLTGRKIALGGATFRRMVLLPPPRPSLRGGGRGGDGVATAGRDGAWIYFDGAMCRIDCCALARWNRGEGTGGDAAAAVPDTIYSVDGGDGSTVRSVDDWEELARYASYRGGEGGILFVVRASSVCPSRYLCAPIVAPLFPLSFSTFARPPPPRRTKEQASRSPHRSREGGGEGRLFSPPGFIAIPPRCGRPQVNNCATWRKSLLVHKYVRNSSNLSEDRKIFYPE